MELKSSITAICLLFVLLFLSAPGCSKGRSDLSSEIYDIDYRGPETHYNLPPSTKYGDRPRHHDSVKPSRVPKTLLRDGGFGGNGRKK